MLHLIKGYEVSIRNKDGGIKNITYDRYSEMEEFLSTRPDIVTNVRTLFIDIEELPADGKEIGRCPICGDIPGYFPADEGDEDFGPMLSCTCGMSFCIGKCEKEKLISVFNNRVSRIIKEDL